MLQVNAIIIYETTIRASNYKTHALIGTVVSHLNRHVFVHLSLSLSRLVSSQLASSSSSSLVCVLIALSIAHI